jgi:hypothetical protein
MTILIQVVLAILLCLLIHEGGHYFTALYFGHRLKFRFAWGKLWKIPIPRFIWTMPDMSWWAQFVTSRMGFITEFVALPLIIILTCSYSQNFWVAYLMITILHLASYDYYAGEDNDFKWRF